MSVSRPAGTVPPPFVMRSRMDSRPLLVISAGGFGGRSIVPDTGEVPTLLTVMFVLRVAGSSMPPIR